MITIHVLPRRIRDFLLTHYPCKLPKNFKLNRTFSKRRLDRLHGRREKGLPAIDGNHVATRRFCRQEIGDRLRHT